VTELVRERVGGDAASLPVWEVLDGLGVSVEGGLGAGEAERRLGEHGPNVIERGSRDGVLRLLWRQVNDPLIWVLLASAALAVALGDTVDALVVLAVVVLNTLIGFVQEYKAGKDIEALASLVPETATVLRDGGRRAVGAAEVVPGDVILLEPGDKVPADARLLSARNVRADESALTGESVPVDKGTGAVAEGTPVAERTSMVHGGTLVVSGTAKGVVTATAAGTELGRISSMLDEATESETPLTRQIAVVSKWISISIAFVAVLLLAAALLRGYPIGAAALAAITLAVAAIPEGLPAIITIALAVGVRRMARRRAVVRLLPAAETLGSTTVICTDKTGTLTKNEMTVKELWTPGEAGGPYELTGVGYAPEGYLLRDGEKQGAFTEDLKELLRAGVLASDAALARDEGGWRVIGDPTEGALIVAAEKLGVEADELRKDRPRRDAVPFESERQFMATLHEGDEGGGHVYLKGAPEVVLDRCAAAGGHPLDREAVLEEVEGMARQGLRVLAFARKPAPPHVEDLDEEGASGDFDFLGLAGMIDPPREEAMAAIEEAHRAGVSVKMITGDHAATAAAIGRQLGLIGEGDEALTGTDLDALSDEELVEAAASTDVFARVAPEHKIRLVRALQARGEVVAMTGDGVNDAPALKQADIGVAMGVTGTDVSKEAADVVLTDDNFASIAAAVEEGRRVYDNLVKALAFLLPTNLGQALIVLFGVAFFPIVGGEPLLPVRPTQVLWINLVVAVALALPLAFEPLEPDAMRRAPRDPKAPIFDRSLLLRTVVVGMLIALGGVGLFLVEYYGRAGAGAGGTAALAEAQTMAVTTVILLQAFYLVECRSLRNPIPRVGLFSNPWVFVGIGAILLLQLGFVYLPFMNALFGTAPLSAGAWLESLLVALVVVPVVGLTKRLARRSG
jgi:magnesium-transporting ATPase (P-type)